jgi:RimJ/RimL family protein N-acetyltransferase
MLIGERIKLIPTKREHIESYIKWINDPEITQYLVMFRPMTKEMEEAWYENLPKRENDFLFAIVISKENEKEILIGNCGIHQVNWKDRFGVCGIMIGEKEYWGQGYGNEAMELLMNYGFKTLNLNRLELMVYDFNQRAIKCYEKLRFTREGLKRQAVFINGNYHDILIMGILQQEWKEKNDKKKN